MKRYSVLFLVFRYNRGELFLCTVNTAFYCSDIDIKLLRNSLIRHFSVIAQHKHLRKFFRQGTYQTVHNFVTLGFFKLFMRYNLCIIPGICREKLIYHIIFNINIVLMIPDIIGSASVYYYCSQPC